MTDLEITKLCAEAMGWEYHETFDRLGDPLSRWFTKDGVDMRLPDYDPLHDDAQAMALVKKLRLFVGGNSDQWMVQPQADTSVVAWGADLNRAICEAVARMQASK